MKPTIKVSIGRIAFNLEEDAYAVLNNYLQALNRHFKGNPEADEIIADIELRMSELLLMRLENPNAVVAVDEAQEIIRIMGNPKDFGDEDDFSSDFESAKDEYSSTVDDKDIFNYFKKKLYRDRTHGIISGVCSGLGHYFKVDPVIIRVIFVALLLIFNLFSLKAALTVVLVYAILAIVTPSAKTFEQKVSMSGTDPSIENIEDRTQTTNTKKYRGSSVSDGLRIFFNIIIGFIVVIVSIILLVCIATLIWLYMDTEVIYFKNYLILLGWNTIDFKIAIILLFILPLIGLIDFFVKLLRRTKFTTSTLVSFIVGMCFWFGAIFYIGNESISFANSTRHVTNETETVVLPTTSDTLYIRLSDEYKNAEQQPRTDNVFYSGSSTRDRSLFIIPKVIVEEDTTLTSYTIEIDKKAYGKSEYEAKRRAKATHLEHNNQDSIFYIKPQTYNRSTTWKREMVSVIVKTPRHKTVIVEKPLNDNYNFRSYSYNEDRHDNFTFGWDSDWIN